MDRRGIEVGMAPMGVVLQKDESQGLRGDGRDGGLHGGEKLHVLNLIVACKNMSGGGAGMKRLKGMRYRCDRTSRTTLSAHTY